MSRVAAVDCGTNSVRLLVADLDPESGRQHNLARELRIVRLGEGLERTGRLSDAALARLFTACEDYATIVESLDAPPLRFVATSAARDAENSHAFDEGVHRRLGVRPEVVSGDVEAQLTFAGATRSLPDLPGPVAVVDIGGGSTEVVVGTSGASTPRMLAGRSMDVGSVRLTERLMPSDPPTRAESDAVAAVVDEALAILPSYGVELGEVVSIVGVAGTVTTVAALLMGLEHADSEQVHHAGFDVAEVHTQVEDLLAMTMAQRRERGVPEGRADVIGAGAVILDRVLRASGARRLTVSVADILDGIAWSIA